MGTTAITSRFGRTKFEKNLINRILENCQCKKKSQEKENDIIENNIENIININDDDKKLKIKNKSPKLKNIKLYKNISINKNFKI